MKNILRVVMASVFTLGFITAPSANAAYTVKPKVGQCFNYSAAEVSAPFAKKNPINCSSTHTAETYLVAKWPLSEPPSALPDGDALEIASSLCRAWGTTGILTDSYFNYWAWYTPDPKAWAKGERWLRCDAMHVTNDTEPYKYASWKGQKFKAKKRI